MTQQTTSSSESGTITSLWVSDQWIRMAGLGGVLGGIVLTLLSISRTGLDFGLGSINIAYPLGYALLAVAVLAGNARYKSSYESHGNRVALLLGLSLASYAASIVVIVLSMRVFSFPVDPFTSLIGIAFFATRIFGTVYGIILWQRTDVSRIAAGLFTVILPSMFVLGPLALLGVPAFGVELPLYVACIVFGYGLWMDTGCGEHDTGSC